MHSSIVLAGHLYLKEAKGRDGAGKFRERNCYGEALGGLRQRVRRPQEPQTADCCGTLSASFCYVVRFAGRCRPRSQGASLQDSPASRLSSFCRDNPGNKLFGAADGPAVSGYPCDPGEGVPGFGFPESSRRRSDLWLVFLGF